MAASNLQLGALNNEAKLIWRNFLSNLFKNWNLLRGHSELNQGPAGLQPDALPLSYIPHLWAISKPYEQIVWNASTQDHLPLVYKTFVNKSATMSTKKIMRPLHGGYKTCYGNSKAVRFDSRMLTFFCSKEGFLKFVFFFTIRQSQAPDHLKNWARPGFEPGTSRTRSANHTPRPTSHFKSYNRKNLWLLYTLI